MFFFFWWLPELQVKSPWSMGLQAIWKTKGSSHQGAHFSSCNILLLSQLQLKKYMFDNKHTLWPKENRIMCISATQ